MCLSKCDTGMTVNQYDYAILVQNDCFCGIMEPVEARIAQVTKLSNKKSISFIVILEEPKFIEKLIKCRFPCGGDHEEFCGGPNGEASFYSITQRSK